MRAAAAMAVALSVGACSPPPNPIVQGERVTLLIESAAETPPSITGDFTAWKPLPATRMAGSDWFQFDTKLEPDARVEYLIFFAADDLRVDPRNPHRVPSVGGEASEISMPKAEPQLELQGSGPPQGLLERHDIAGPGGSRRVAVYRPVQTDRPLPIVYFNDGSLMIEKGEVPQILDRLVAAARIQPLIAVFVDPISRTDDYKADAAFRDWFVTTLVPLIERSLPAAPVGRAIVGVSRGAAAALDIAWRHPDLFGGCGLLIPSISPTNLTNDIARAPAKALRLSIITGRYDVEWLREGQALHEALDAKDYRVTYREVPEGHNVQTWRAHLDDVLIGLGY